MQVIIKDAFNHEFNYDVNYLRLQTHEVIGGVITSFKMYTQEGKLISGSLDYTDKMYIDDFGNI